jgi:hypothetical protein
MTTRRPAARRPATRRLVNRIVPPLGGGALALAAMSSAGAPGWSVVLAAVTGAVIGVLPALLPQESAHRRDAWRDWLRHRERMARLRITAADAVTAPRWCETVSTNSPAGQASPATVACTATDGHRPGGRPLPPGPGEELMGVDEPAGA